jgi:hypothetical protein
VCKRYRDTAGFEQQAGGEYAGSRCGDMKKRVQEEGNGGDWEEKKEKRS